MHVGFRFELLRERPEARVLAEIALTGGRFNAKEVSGREYVRSTRK